MKNTILILICVSANLVNAQHIIFATGGISSPQGDLKSGFAQTGSAFEIGYYYQFKNNLGVIATFRDQSWSTKVEVNPYKAISFNAGAIYSIKIINKFFIEPKVSIGYSNVYTPATTIPHGPDQSAQSASPEWASSFTYLAGIGLRYDFKVLSIFLNGDYTSASPTFKYNSNTIKINQSINSLNITTGIGFRFKKAKSKE